MTSSKRRKVEADESENSVEENITENVEVQTIKLRVKQKFLTRLICQYNAMESEKDKVIFDILCVLERSYQINLKPLFPIVWGERAKDNYEKLCQLGETLHTKLTVDQVLDYLDPKLMWNSLLKSEQTTAVKMPKKDLSNRFYDARFILRLLATLVDDDSKMNTRKFVIVNGLSFAFAATSFISRSERCVAYLVLRRFLLHLMKSDSQSFPEKCLYVYLLQVFKNSIESPIQRLPHVVAHFFARVTKLILHPEDPVYQPLLSFFLLKPNIDIQNVPEIYKMLLSSSTQNYMKERHWCLRLILDSLIEPNDYNILQKRYGLKLLLALFGSIVADQETKKYILLSLRAILQHRSIANDLYVRQNLHSWIVVSLQNKVLTRWERVFLCQLFIMLFTHLKEIFCDASNSGTLETKWHGTIAYKTCRILGNKVYDELEKENDGAKNIWLPKLKELLDKDRWTSLNCDAHS
uniref:Nucleolar pre-ribosomal-associated protein 1 C-terminal domain-containing protein n=1 Tax=Setaria digitata TaxID=48799 RepID=A0A915PS98_9BILA